MARSRSGPSRLERLLLSVMGPPQLGDPEEPPPAPAADTGRCPKCGRPYAEHEVVREPRLTYVRCPEP